MTAVPGYRDVPIQPWRPDAPVDLAEAEDFLRTCYAEVPALGPVEPRLAIVREQVDAVGTYVHTQAELVHGARMAWRNSSRCIGRLYWRSLVVLDRRTARTPDKIFDHILTHLGIASGTYRSADTEPAPGRLRPVISIFGQAVPGRPMTRIWNDQLVRYAGYRTEDGSVIGDPRFVEFTEAVTALGWRGKGEAFDVLPLVLDSPGSGPKVYELPESAVHEVALTHPEHRWFAELGLRWYAVPAIANMRLSIGGVNYPLAPFSGWYMGTEIGARNLADADRYNMLPVIGARLGLDTSNERTLWRDRALVELNRAVLWSFEQAGVRIADHHSESERFLTHIAREERAGRKTPADWTWIVPPLSSAITPVFHRYYHEADQRPNFYLDADARLYAKQGRPGAIPGTDRAAAMDTGATAEDAAVARSIPSTLPTVSQTASIPAAVTIRATAAVPLAVPAALLGQARVSHGSSNGNGYGDSGSSRRNGYGAHSSSNGDGVHSSSNGDGGAARNGGPGDGAPDVPGRLAAGPWVAAPAVRSFRPQPSCPVVVAPTVTEPPPPVRPAAPAGNISPVHPANPASIGPTVLVTAQPLERGPGQPPQAPASGPAPASVQAAAGIQQVVTEPAREPVVTNAEAATVRPAAPEPSTAESPAAGAEPAPPLGRRWLRSRRGAGT